MLYLYFFVFYLSRNHLQQFLYSSVYKKYAYKCLTNLKYRFEVIKYIYIGTYLKYKLLEHPMILHP